jgi:hypothetical protein
LNERKQEGVGIEDRANNLTYTTWKLFEMNSSPRSSIEYPNTAENESVRFVIGCGKFIGPPSLIVLRVARLRSGQILVDPPETSSNCSLSCIKVQI